MSIYEKIIAGEENGWVIWENEDYAAILSIEPYNEGHTLVLPKKNIGDDLFELGQEEYDGLMRAVKKVGKILKKVFNAERLVIWVRGYEVAHVHVHLIPSVLGLDMVSEKKKLVKHQELEGVYRKIMSGI